MAVVCSNLLPLVSRHASNVGYEVTLQRYYFIEKNCCSLTLYIRQIMRDATLVEY